MSASQPAPDMESDSALPDLSTFRRPCLRPDVPIMWRSATAIQIGPDVIVERVDRSLVAWMTSLDGSQSPQVIAESLTIPEHHARRLVRALLAAGALEDAARIPSTMRWGDTAERDDARARFGAVMATIREPFRSLEVADRRGAARVSIVGSGPLADSVAAAVMAAGLALVDSEGDLAILANALHPDVPAHFDNPVQDRPHLHVGAFAARAVIGPLVVPGRTGCLRCAHLHHRDADPAWPLVSVQWAQCIRGLHPRPADPLLVRMAGTLSALLARCMFDDPDDPTTWAGHALEVSLPDLTPVRVARPPHPLCGCLWPLDGQHA